MAYTPGPINSNPTVLHRLGVLRKPLIWARLLSFLGISLEITIKHRPKHYKLQPFQSPSFLTDRFLTHPLGVLIT